MNKANYKKNKHTQFYNRVWWPMCVPQQLKVQRCKKIALSSRQLNYMEFYEERKIIN